VVRLTGGRWYWAAGGYPSEAISLRSATADNIVIVDRTGGGARVIGEMDRPSAKELIYDDAVYLHLGRQFIVRKLDLENRTCFVEEMEVDYWTDAVVKTDLQILTEDQRGEVPSAREGLSASWSLGDVLVRTEAEKFKKLRFHSHENVGFGEIHLPPEEMQTRALSLVFPEGSAPFIELSRHDEAMRAAILAGAGRMLHELAPVFLMCDRRDLGLAERVRDPHFLLPAIHFFDHYPGGTGLSEGLAPRLAALVRAAEERLGNCPCGDGCPSCIGVDFGAAAAGQANPLLSGIGGRRVREGVAGLFRALS
jgi:DEAD/DEAH box helicase domain-containing protein